MLLNAKSFTAAAQRDESPDAEETGSIPNDKEKEPWPFAKWFSCIALNGIGVITAMLELWRLVLKTVKAVLSILTSAVIAFLILFGIIMTFGFACGDSIREGWVTYTIIMMWILIVVAIVAAVLVLPLLNTLLSIVLGFFSPDSALIALKRTCVNLISKTDKSTESICYSDISLVHGLICWFEKWISPILRILMYLIIPGSLGYFGYWFSFIDSAKPEYMSDDWWVAIALIGVCCIIGIYISRVINKALKETSIIFQDE